MTSTQVATVTAMLAAFGRGDMDEMLSYYSPSLSGGVGDDAAHRLAERHPVRRETGG